MSLLQNIVRIWSYFLVVVLMINAIDPSVMEMKSTTPSIHEQAVYDIRQLRDDVRKEERQFNIDRVKYERERRILIMIQNTNVIQLNVGGDIIITTRETLTKIPRSTLALLFNGRWEQKLQRDENGNIFLDFDPLLFRHLLDQLQTLEANDSITIHPPSQPSLVEPFKTMLRKLDFYQSSLETKDVITFNVGGQTITNRRTTFTPVSNSTFDTITPPSQTTNFNNKSDVFLDYDPKVFQHLIKQLREESFENISNSELSLNEEKISFDNLLIDLSIYHEKSSSFQTTVEEYQEITVIVETTDMQTTQYFYGENLQTEQYEQTEQTTPSTRVSDYIAWYQNGTTIAGGNGWGDELNQLHRPHGIYVDDDNECIYIADRYNHRIVEWKYNADMGQVVAGGNGQGDQMNQLDSPVYVIMDKHNDSFIICDAGNRRVVRWPRQPDATGETIISDIECCGLAMDNNGSLYVVDNEKQEVRRWKIGETEGTLVAGGNDRGSHSNQFDGSSYLFIDAYYSIYVSDNQNHRVMKWMKDAQEGILVAGGQGEGSQLTQLGYPNGVIVDHSGNVYVADSTNHRIVRWSEGSEEGVIIVGENGVEKQSDQLNLPLLLSFDRQNNLYVADADNHRIQKFEIII